MHRNCSLVVESLALSVGIAALAWFTRPTTAQVVYQWRPFSECVISGKCSAANTTCGGPSTAGRRCRYCSDPLTVYDCEFNLFEQCFYDITNPPAVNCGLQFVGACNGAGTLCANGVLNGLTCPRPNCY